MPNVSAFQIFDIKETVEKLMAYQYLRVNQLKLQRKAEDVSLNAYGTVQKLFGTLQDNLNSLSDAFNSVLPQISSSNANVATATATNNDLAYVPHTVVVSALAASQVNTAENPFTSNTNALNISEFLTLSNQQNPDDNFSIQIQSTDSLQTICNNINTSPFNIGVTAAVVASTGTDGATQYNLVITSTSGTANQISISDSGNYFNFQQTTQAQDAQFTFDGFNEVSSSNAVTSVLNGMTINLQNIGTTVLTVNQNEDTDVKDVQTAMQSVLTSYNAIITFLDGNQMIGLYDDTNHLQANYMNTGFPLIKQQLQEIMGDTYNGSNNSPGDIHFLLQAGIVSSGPSNVIDQFDEKAEEVVSYGSMQFNQPQPNAPWQVTFSSLLTTDFSSLYNYFMDPENGLIANLNTFVNDSIMPANTTGVVYNATSGVNSAKQFISEEIGKEEERLRKVREDLEYQYAKLNAMMSYYDHLSQALDKQFSQLDSYYRGK